jgi:hypothetical protein
MTRDEAAGILDLPREQAIDAILILAEKAGKFDQLHGEVSPTCPSGMIPPYLKEPGKRRHKKPGQKKGHPGVSRSKPEKIDYYENLTLDNCPLCNGPLGNPAKHHKRYVVDIPEAEPKVTEETMNGYWCSNCKKIVYPKSQNAMPNSTLGLHMLILTAWLHYWVGMSVRNVVRLLSAFWGFNVSPGGLTQAWNNLAAALKPVYDDIGERVKNAAVLHADETGWRISGITHWLWGFVTDKWCYFMIDKSRGSPVVKRAIGNFFQGVLICDFWGAYNKICALAKQRCFYHLLTELEKVDKSNKSSGWKTFRKKLVRLVMDAIRLDERKKTFSADLFARRKAKLYSRLDLLNEFPREDKDVNRLVKRLIRHRNELFTFLEYEGVSPYNNHAERQMRTPVKTRKISQQNRSDRGAEAHAILMSLFSSAELQGLNPIEKVSADIKNMLSTIKMENFNFKKAA